MGALVWIGANLLVPAALELVKWAIPEFLAKRSRRVRKVKAVARDRIQRFNPRTATVEEIAQEGRRLGIVATNEPQEGTDGKSD